MLNELDIFTAVGLGGVVQWVLMVGGVCAYLAPFMPPATSRSSRVYKAVRQGVDALAGNFRNARNRTP